MTLGTEQLRDLFVAALPASFDADTTPPGVGQLFTPDTHRRALQPDVTLVRGARGVGKTVWFGSLQNARARELAAVTYSLPVLRDRLSVSAGFGAILAPESYPVPALLRELLTQYPAETIWRAVCLRSLEAFPSTEPVGWPGAVDALHRNPALSDEMIARVDSKAASENRTHLVLFDALDRMSDSSDETERLVDGLLKLALEIRTRTRHIRLKIFSRPDLVDRQLRFTDSSKLTANAVDLTWTDSNLYGLLFTTLGNAESPLAAPFRAQTDPWEAIQPDVWRNAELSADRGAQERLFTRLAGPFMGANHRRGRTYSWLPNHLSDGRDEVSPRSFLSALRHAVDDTRNNRATHPQPLHYESIKKGVQRASVIRVQEISEDIPWVETAVKPLVGLQVPMTKEALFAAWGRAMVQNLIRNSARHTDPGRSVRLGPRDPEDYESLMSELRALGVVRIRSDSRIDLPDVYRVAFGLGRKGGVPRAF
jgi:hypothetical protein